MNEINEIPEVIEIENTWITLSDGCRLAARIWMPENAENHPVPAILEYLPYRKRDGTTERDALTHPYMAARGYACIRVDMRGNGDSDGLMEDEYTRQEQDDAVEVIQWLAGQSWCSGKVGMIGISWGGFNGLQVAALQPGALKAVISICSTDDRYADDIHYMGGCLLNYNLGWATTMLGYSSRPPDPALVGDSWRKTWMNRLENLPFLIKPWLEHQHRDAYWKHGSICENYSDIKVPVYLVGGWADGYSNTIFRMLENLEVPVKALIGPWAHKYPHFAKPGPAVGFLRECLKFWDHWLKEKPTDVMDEKVKLYIQDSHAPKSSHTHMPGQWTVRETWPPEDVEAKVLYPGNGALGTDPVSGVATLSTPQTLGSRGGRWFSFGTGPDLPADQRPDDAEALVFDTPELEAGTLIMGAPVLNCRLRSDKPLGILAARLNDVRPDGSVTRISYGVVNLTHRESHEDPRPLETGRDYDIRLKLNEIAWALKPGHKIRLSLSNSYWPLVWPSPEAGELTLDLSRTSLELPLAGRAGEPGASLGKPESAGELEQVQVRPSRLGWSVEENMGTGAVTTRILDDYGDRIISGHGLRTAYRAEEIWSAGRDDPLSARGSMSVETRTGRGEWQVSTSADTRMRADRDFFYVHGRVRAMEGESEVFSRSWDLKIPRNLV
ncbi:MAG: CocE/NonD family hydrolase [Desulfobacterales bacterium]|nr:CocE/NonD family hydrolase [Desulfobacterales bacterium]